MVQKIVISGFNLKDWFSCVNNKSENFCRFFVNVLDNMRTKTANAWFYEGKEEEIERLKAQLAEQDEFCTKLKGDLRTKTANAWFYEGKANDLESRQKQDKENLKDIKLMCGSFESENQELKLYIDTLKDEIEELKNIENRVISEKYTDCDDHKCKCIPYKEEM